MYLTTRCNLIAIPFTRGGVYDFWSFIKDDGRTLDYGMVRVPACRLTDTEMLGRILKDEKKRLTSDNFRRATCAMKESGSIKVYRQELAIASQHRTIIGY